MEDKFKIVVTAVVIIAVVGLLLTLFTAIHVDTEDELIEGMTDVAVTNVTVFETFTAGEVIRNYTNMTAAGNLYGSLVEVRPGAVRFSCNVMYIGYNATVTAGTHKLIKLPTDNYICFNNGSVRLALDGNWSNASGAADAADSLNPFLYNISYVTKRFDGAYNTSINIQSGLYQGAGNQTTFYTLIVLVVVVAIALAGLAYFKFRNDGEGISLPGGGFSPGNLFDKFER